MPTKNRRIATYLPENIDRSFNDFKQEHNLKGDSAALIAILESFFGVSQEVARLGSSESTILTQRIEAVEQRISQIKDELLSELQRDLLTSRTQSIEQAKDELLSELQGELPKTEALPGQLELLVESNEQIERPDNELPSESKSEIPKEEKQYIETAKPSSTNQTFATKDLADRLGMNSSTVSHWRPTGGRPKTPEQLLEITRKKDPDGIGWIYLPEVKRFRPERDIHSELPEALQSDSLITTEPEF
jgi:hypothetical protein